MILWRLVSQCSEKPGDQEIDVSHQESIPPRGKKCDGAPFDWRNHGEGGGAITHRAQNVLHRCKEALSANTTTMDMDKSLLCKSLVQLIFMLICTFYKSSLLRYVQQCIVQKLLHTLIAKQCVKCRAVTGWWALHKTRAIASQRQLQ